MASKLVDNNSLQVILEGVKKDQTRQDSEVEDLKRTIETLNIRGEDYDLPQTMVGTTYKELVQLRNNGGLHAGTWYRITDYETIISHSDAISAGNDFDVIVLATSEKSLSESAKATLREEDDGYFNNSNLNAWELKYCLDNDTKRFDWASENGKGVIYYMKDENGNECPYDFKNIMFRYDQFRVNDTWVAPYCFTFSYVDESYEVFDISAGNISVTDDEGKYQGAKNNVKRPTYNETNTTQYCLVRTIFVSANEYDTEGFLYGFVGNVVGASRSLVAFKGKASNNTIGDFTDTVELVNSSDNVVGDYCIEIYLNECYGNVIGEACTDFDIRNWTENEIGYRCETIFSTDGNFSYSKIGSRCRGVSPTGYNLNCEIGRECTDIVIKGTGPKGGYIKIGDNCKNISIEHDTLLCEIGEGCSNIKIGYFCKYIKIGANCKVIDIPNQSTYVTIGNNCGYIKFFGGNVTSLSALGTNTHISDVKIGDDNWRLAVLADGEYRGLLSVDCGFSSEKSDLSHVQVLVQTSPVCTRASQCMTKVSKVGSAFRIQYIRQRYTNYDSLSYCDTINWC